MSKAPNPGVPVTPPQPKAPAPQTPPGDAAAKAFFTPPPAATLPGVQVSAGDQPAATAGNLSAADAAALAAPTPTPEPADIQSVKDILFAAIKETTGQAKAEAAAFVESLAPVAAVCLVMKRAGDERADTALRAMKTTALMTAAIYGIRLLQSHEVAFISAINVGLRLALGPGVGDLAGTVAAGVVGAVEDAIKKP